MLIGRRESESAVAEEEAVGSLAEVCWADVWAAVSASAVVLEENENHDVLVG
jgi:hypothetical protein